MIQWDRISSSVYVGGRTVDIRYSERKPDSPLWVGAKISVQRGDLATMPEEGILGVADELAALFAHGFPDASAESLSFVRGLTVGSLICARRVPR